MDTPQVGGDLSFQVLVPMMNALPGLGLDEDDFLRRLGVKRENMHDPHLRLPRPLVVGVLEELALDCNQPNLGLVLAAAMPVGAFQAIDFYVASSPTLRVAVKRLCEIYQVFTSDLMLTLEEEGEDAQIVWRYKMTVPRIRHIVEFAVGLTIFRGWQLGGDDIKIRAVHFVHPSPEDTRQHGKFFRAPVLFGQPLDKYVFDASYLERPCVAANARLSSALEPLVKELQSRSRASDPFITRTRTALATYLHDGERSIDATAAALQLSRRKLQRRLAELGTSYTDLLDDVRRSKALALLREGSAPAEVAAAVGFQGSDALYRAYRRWTGESIKSAGG